MRNRQAVKSIFDLSVPGRRGAEFATSDVPGVSLDEGIPASMRATGPLPLPEISEPDVIRHFVNLSTLNMSVDTHFYPLGSCTMKYNPKRHERLAGLPGIVDVHPYQEPSTMQGLLQMIYEMQQFLGEIAGLPSVSIQPAAGAQGELTALMVAAAYFEDRKENRTKVLFPASAHGTNPASAALAGYNCVQLNSSVGGLIDVVDLKAHLSDDVAVFMVTNPNTLGLFEKDIATVASMVHDVGALMYIDGANMNAILGKTRPGDFGGDMMHYNVHKTFTGPHGAGGPGSGPIAVRSFLGDYLPGPVVVKNTDGTYALKNPPKSIGRVRSFYANVGILMRGYFYIRTLGPDGLKAVSEQAVLNANYLKAKLKDVFSVPYGDYCLHEFVASATEWKKNKGISAMDIAKGLIDQGFHPPTVYFPLVVAEAMMMEPTETESKETLDAYVESLKSIVAMDPEILHQAPLSTAVSRPDEVGAARQPVLCWMGGC
jgi:glycine dehydrogenase subunit 2